MDNTAVLEREPATPVFDESEWARQMESAGTAPPSQGGMTANGQDDEEPITLVQALGLPESLEDLWPNHAYIPPKLFELESMSHLADQALAKGASGDLWGMVSDAVKIIQGAARRIEGGEIIPVTDNGKIIGYSIHGGAFVEVTEEEIKKAFDEDEIINVILHILQRQGIKMEPDPGNAVGGRSTGVKSFQRSVATTQATSLPVAETSLTPNSDSSSDQSKKDLGIS